MDVAGEMDAVRVTASFCLGVAGLKVMESMVEGVVAEASW
jgi:hypothetical protein